MDLDEHQELIRKYKEKIKEEFGENPTVSPKVSSREYHEFKKELYPNHYSLYEKACNFSEKLLKLKTDTKKSAKLIRDLEAAHLNVTPAGVSAFSFILPFVVMFFGALVSFALFKKMFFVIFFLFAGLAMIPALQKLPSFMANTWRMKASNQMVQAVFYMVTYMRHTSNIERAIEFSADHLEAPLSLDFRKILWDVETQRFSSIRDSANDYLEHWKEWDKEFVESFHLIEASLFDPSEDRRLSLLDKSLDVILNGTYENMLHYAHSLKSPMTMLHMLGIILPILGLVILPLVVSFLNGGDSPLLTAAYIALIYNITLPVSVYYLGRSILSKRPAGYGATDIGSMPGLKKFKNVNVSLSKNIKISLNPLYFAIMVFIIAFVIGFSPLILHGINPAFEIQNEAGTLKMMEYVCPAEFPNCEINEKIGPYGIGASLLSLVVIAGLGVSIGLFYSLRSKNVIKIRRRTKQLEDEFSSALFQLGNRLGDGLPAELALGKVAETMKGTTSGQFFNLAERNITRLGMGLEQAIFDPKVGALASFPSKVIESSMKVLVESMRKGPNIAAQSLLSMSRYIKEIHRVEERLKDLMSDVISSMKAQIKFLTPVIAGIVIGITSMISTILTRLSAQLAAFASRGEQVSSFADLLDIFGIGIPTFYFQIVVGVYIVQIAFILTVLSNGVENGSDKLGERFELGNNITKSTLLYCAIAGIVMLLFNLFANSIMRSTLV